ncbi:GTP-dependent dephospho-CoA kinase family protein [Halococcus sp. AFM35]|uniref:GTP-dependent dephospho-CoA kinase family protein n=1 Tax=Halococcus sp. AFM35 TaxID=3421653 RepID=UPI003EB98A10
MAGGESEPDVVLTLPDDLRGAFKDPLGPIHTDANRLSPDLGEPVIAVGDVVTRHLTRAGVRPDLAVLDWVTEREALAETERPDIAGYDERIDVTNPAAGLSEELLRALRTGVERSEKTVVVVDGEEDLATLPALVVAPNGASVVYGQPGEGMVHVPVDTEARTRARELLSRMDGDDERLRDILGSR